jgi:hypothetical protein
MQIAIMQAFGVFRTKGISEESRGGLGEPEMFFLLPKNIPGPEAEVSRRRDLANYYAKGLQKLLRKQLQR